VTMSTPAVTIIGSYLSPYVRKVLVFLEQKQIDYTIDPLVPFFGNDEFSRISPVRRVPVYIDDSVTLSDSTVICEYLEEQFPEPALYPATPQAKARARWLEEYADTRMGEVFIWRLFNELVIKRFVWGEQADEEVVRKARDIEAPQVFDYLELEFSRERPFLFGKIGMAHITVASFMRNAAFAGYAIDAARWPVMHAVVSRTWELPAFARLGAFEDISLRTPPAEQRAALLAAGAPISSHTYGDVSPRRGILGT
jgi:glutathione S-transferase